LTDEPTNPEPVDPSSLEKSIRSGRGFDIERLTAEDLPVIFGRYEILAILGEGGMARVFRAELRGPAGFRKPVALKVIKPREGLQASSGEVLDLVREACMGGRLKHPNLVDVYELGEEDGQHFISMELVEGCTLTQLIL
jgi:serine/threonine-protein kinase